MRRHYYIVIDGDYANPIYDSNDATTFSNGVLEANSYKVKKSIDEADELDFSWSRPTSKLIYPGACIEVYSSPDVATYKTNLEFVGFIPHDGITAELNKISGNALSLIGALFYEDIILSDTINLDGSSIIAAIEYLFRGKGNIPKADWMTWMESKNIYHDFSLSMDDMIYLVNKERDDDAPIRTDEKIQRIDVFKQLMEKAYTYDENGVPIFYHLVQNGRQLSFVKDDYTRNENTVVQVIESETYPLIGQMRWTQIFDGGYNCVTINGTDYDDEHIEWRQDAPVGQPPFRYIDTKDSLKSTAACKKYADALLKLYEYYPQWNVEMELHDGMSLNCGDIVYLKDSREGREAALMITEMEFTAGSVKITCGPKQKSILEYLNV